MCCSLMMHGRNNGKKVKAINILKHTFEIIHLLSGEVSLICGSSFYYDEFVSFV